MTGKLAHVSRYLGGRFHVDLWAHVEVSYRLTAIKIGWNSCAHFCCSKVTSRFRKLVFGSLVYSPALAGMEIWTLSESQVDQLNTRVLFYVRKLMRDDACLKPEKPEEHHRAMTNTTVWRTMGLVPAGLELRIRRLKWLQEMVKHPANNDHLWTALPGKADFEVVTPELPWIQQIYTDLFAGVGALR